MPGNKKTGFTEPISANTGIGSSLPAASFTSACPPSKDPVNPTALTFGCSTSAFPTSKEAPCTCENTAGGNPHDCATAATRVATASEVCACAGCAFTITGQPAASAHAVSPPAVE